MEHTTYSTETLQKVKEALCWAYRNGYSGAESAAEELAGHLGERLVKTSLGTYGDALGFEETEAPVYEPEPYAAVDLS